MINRELIRLKLVQVLYSYLQKGSHNPDVAEKELLLSLDKAYDLYNYMLLLMVETSRISLRMLEMRESRSKKLNDGIHWSHKFVDNRFILQLESNRELRAYCDEQELSWANHEDFVRNLYNKVEESDFYQQYMNSDTSSYEEDREIWRLIYRHLIVDNEELAGILEDINVYWNDDKTIIDTFVLKTINRFTEKSTAAQPLMPKFKTDTDRDFAIKLMRRALMGQEHFYGLIGTTTRKWDFERIALMDRIILQLGLAEITTFPNIPISVSINEYVDIAKMYSTPKSGKYINATLDTIAKKLIEEGKLVKETEAE
ncbi:MAG: transcription antitermination factor NusB [Bacteroidaceae bacterium]|nr:transcription antitermination factor NusB [Bacteroidaceae bacterium]MBR4516589.1 transcription antitermination factor NusB [Bacteroidaceae bacterium]